MADTGVLDVDENLIWARLLNRDFLEDDGYAKLALIEMPSSLCGKLTLTGFFDNLSPLLSWDTFFHARSS